MRDNYREALSAAREDGPPLAATKMTASLLAKRGTAI